MDLQMQQHLKVNLLYAKNFYTHSLPRRLGAMTPNEQGRHCTSCAKTVIDFTAMNDDEVKYFFLNKKEEKVCGRFKNVQLHRIIVELPHNIFYLQMPGWKKFLVASLLVFSTTLFSCETTVKGEPDFTCSTTGLIIPTEKNI